MKPLGLRARFAASIFILLSFWMMPVGAQGRALEREWSVRRLALQQHLDVNALRALAGHPAWDQREIAWEALERHLALGGGLPEALGQTLVLALGDGHPGVRLAALECFGQLDRSFELEAATARGLSRESWPELRLALLEALERVACPSALELCLELVQDEDERVAQAARRVLFGLPASAAHARVKTKLLLEDLQRLPERGPLEAQRALQWIWNSEPDPELWQDLREVPREALTGEWQAALDGLVSTLKLAQGAVCSEAELVSLMDAWIFLRNTQCLPDGLLLATSQSGSEALARAWLLSLDALQRGDTSQLPWRSLDHATRLDLDLQPGLLRALIQCVGAQGALGLALELEIEASLCTELLGELGGALDSWDWFLESPAAKRWWAPDAGPKLQEALLRAAAATLSRNGDVAAGQLLTRGLGSSTPRLHDLAFQALAKDLQAGDWCEELARDWARLERSDKLRCLAWLPRGQALPAFREALMEWGADLDERPQALELLAGFQGDAEVHALLSRWLGEDFEALEQLRGAEASAAWPPIEDRLQAELRALAALAGPGPEARDRLQPVARVLRASFGLSAQLAKTGAIQLGRSAAGRMLLFENFKHEMEPRTRVEACLALLLNHTPTPGIELSDLLIADFEVVEDEARLPLISALGSASTSAALDFLQALASDGADFSQRVVALDALAELPLVGADGKRSGIEFLKSVALAEPELEFRRVALVALAPKADLDLFGWLVEDLLLVHLGRTEVELGMASSARELLRGELLASAGQALSRLCARRAFLTAAQQDEFERLGRILARELFRRPMAEAETSLLRRFEGRELRALEFEWRGELALALQLGRVRGLAAALEAWPEWWRMDGELLHALAQACGPDRELEARLWAGAVVALVAEPGVELQKQLASARLSLLDSAWQRRDWAVASRLAHALVLDQRAGRVSRVSWTRMLGYFDRGGGVDPEARLRCTELLARAHRELEAGRPSEARAGLMQALARVGQSRWARLECERLGALLEAR